MKFLIGMFKQGEDHDMQNEDGVTKNLECATPPSESSIAYCMAALRGSEVSQSFIVHVERNSCTPDIQVLKGFESGLGIMPQVLGRQPRMMRHVHIILIRYAHYSQIED